MNPRGCKVLVFAKTRCKLNSVGGNHDLGNINFKARLLVSFTFALIVFLGVFIFNTYQHELRDIDEASERLAESALELFRVQINSDAAALAVSIGFISENRELAALMVKGDRGALLASANPVYQELSKNQKVTHFYFQTPNRVNFLRVHNPAFYGDLINRYVALKAEKTQNLFYGIELGKFGHLTLRVVSPWIVDGKLIGYLELGEEIGHILENIKNTLDVDFILTIDKNLLKQSDWEEGSGMFGHKGKWNSLLDSVIAGTSLGDIGNLLKIVKSGRDKIFSDEKKGIANFFYKDDMNSRYDVNIMRLEDVSGRSVASLYILWNITGVIAGALYYVLLVGAVSLVTGALLFVLFYITINRVEGELSFFYKSLEAASADNACLAAAVEQADEMVVMTDKDGTIQYVNLAFEGVTGYSREEILGKKPDILSSGKQDETFYRTMWNTIYAGDIWKGRFVNKKKNGTFFDSDCVISPVRGQDGAIVNYVSLQRDVTRDRKLESKLRASQKMEAIGTLAGGIAHDFNNILTGIIGYTELANDDLKEGSEAKENLDAALKAGARAKDLVAEILTFSRDGEQAVNQVYLQTVVRDTLAMLRPIIPSTISIRESIDDSLPAIMANGTQITQVIMNLCTNAEHSMRKNGGVLKITLGGFEADADFASLHEGVAPGFYVRLTIRDTGHGMDKETADRIFEPFFTTKDVGEGTGMGLSVVHGIVCDHGGLITVSSELGKGTTFTIYLPVQKHPVVEDEAGFIFSTGGSERVLYVDDEESIAMMVERSLSRLGYDVVAVSNPCDALDLFKSAPESFDIVLTDQTMPSMTGIELAREVLRISPDTPVVLCTGYSHTVNEEIARDMGIVDFVMKPISKSVLSEVIRRALDNVNH